MNRKTAILASVALMALLFSGCQARKVRQCDGAVWNTTYHIVYDSDKDMSDSIRKVMRDVELSLSPFNDASLITAINRNESKAVDPMITEVFEASLKVNAMSAGAFDPTVAPLINLWGFGYKSGDAAEVGQSSIDSVMMTVGIADCRISGGTMVKKHPATEFNFSAITKGYGCDRVADMLAASGSSDIMVEIGGEIALRGKNPKGHPWRIQIDAPVVSNDSVVHDRLSVIEVTDCGVATSGNYRNYHTAPDGRMYGHTISPVTGRPAEADILSATVIAPSCMLADALATACMAMNRADALAMIERADGVECLLVAGKGNGWELIRSSGFPLRD